MTTSWRNARGFSMVETLIATTVTSLVLLGIYRLWKHNQVETLRLQAKIEARNQLVLASKKLSRSITMAGIGMPGVPAISRSDEVEEGTDTLILYTNSNEQSSALTSDYTNGNSHIQVVDASIFSGVNYVGISDDTHGELRKITYRGPGVITILGGFEHNYTVAQARVYPAVREKYFTDQDNDYLMRVSSGTSVIVSKQVHNFQVSFLDKDGNATNTVGEIRSVNFSFTGEYEPIRGSLNSLVYTNTAIPRNLLL